LETLVELARAEKVELPSYTEVGLHELVFKENYESLADYLRGFAYTCRVLQDRESLERVAYELAYDSFAEGVRYIEPRLAPQLHVNEKMDLPTVLMSVERGLRQATDEFNSQRKAGEPPYAYGIIVCAMRMFHEGFSYYYKRLLEAHPHSPVRTVFGMASIELVRAVVKGRDEDGVSVVGFDLAGQEDGYPAHDHIEAYRYAHHNFLRKTVHAGEAYGAESIFEAITDLYADRIGHGYYLFDAEKIQSPVIEDREQYIRALVQYIADMRTTIEVCLTSNLQTNPGLNSLADHPLRKMLDLERRSSKIASSENTPPGKDCS